MKLYFAFVSIILLGFSASAKAQFFDGSMVVVVTPFEMSSSSFTGSSFSLNQKNLVTFNETGTFASFVPTLSDLTASTGTVSGLSASLVAKSIPNFFLFSTPDTILGTSGTTPLNRFAFDLTSVTETAFTGTTASFEGYGTFTDSLGELNPTSGTFNLAYSSQKGYTITLSTDVAPEPSTWALLLGGLGALAFLRTRFNRV